MDNFLENQNIGDVVDTKNEFTVEGSRGRDKLLQSIPREKGDGAFRLALATIAAPGATGRFEFSSVDGEPIAVLSFSQAPLSLAENLVDELRIPFGPNSPASKLAKAIFRATQLGATVRLFSPPHQLTLNKTSLSIPAGFKAPKSNQFDTYFHDFRDISTGREFRKSVPSLLSPFIQKHESLLPLESLEHRTNGYFDYRVKPFTAIRSYVACESGRSGFKLDLWRGPYDKIDPETVILSKREPGKFLFLRWRPRYGNPTFMHYSPDVGLKFGKQEYRATFWISSVEEQAKAHFFSHNVASDPITIDGPLGLTAVVAWPNLKHDIRGTRLVEDRNYQEALEWTQHYADLTADCLARNLDPVIDRLSQASLVGRGYVDEIVAKIRLLWGSAAC